MTRENTQFDPFDPMAAIGREEESLANSAPSVEPAGEPADASEELLLRLIDQATRPPASLRLDRGRLRAAIAAEPILQASRPAQILSPFRHVRLSRLIPLAAAAVLLLVASLVMRHQFETNSVTPSALKPDSGSTPIATGQPTLAVGLSPDDAAQLVENRPTDLVVVVPRLTDQPQPTAAGEDQGSPPNTPVVTDTAPLTGTAAGDGAGQPGDMDNPDAVFLSYNR